MKSWKTYQLLDYFEAGNGMYLYRVRLSQEDANNIPKQEKGYSIPSPAQEWLLKSAQQTSFADKAYPLHINRHAQFISVHAEESERHVWLVSTQNPSLLRKENPLDATQGFICYDEKDAYKLLASIESYCDEHQMKAGFSIRPLQLNMKELDEETFSSLTNTVQIWRNTLSALNENEPKTSQRKDMLEKIESHLQDLDKLIVLYSQEPKNQEAILENINSQLYSLHNQFKWYSIFNRSEADQILLLALRDFTNASDQQYLPLAQKHGMDLAQLWHDTGGGMTGLIQLLNQYLREPHQENENNDIEIAKIVLTKLQELELNKIEQTPVQETKVLSLLAPLIGPAHFEPFFEHMYETSANQELYGRRQVTPNGKLATLLDFASIQLENEQKETAGIEKEKEKDLSQLWNRKGGGITGCIAVLENFLQPPSKGVHFFGRSASEAKSEKADRKIAKQLLFEIHIASRTATDEFSQRAVITHLLKEQLSPTIDKDNPPPQQPNPQGNLSHALRFVLEQMENKSGRDYTP